MTRTRIGSALLLAIGVGAAAFLIARVSFSGGNTEAQQPPQQVVPLEDIARQADLDSQKPRFVGYAAGIFIAPAVTDWPSAERDQRERLVAGGCVSETPERGKALDFPREPKLPANYSLSATSPEVIACSGVVTGVNREYTGVAANGLPATVLVGRSIQHAWGVDAAIDRVTTRTIAGRNAVLISPIGNGTGQTSQVLFPETSGLTFINAFNLSEVELLEVAAAVADASK